ncbi:MAG: YbhB/YbcL family Raf kinase inhibitor-like protein [Anaerolineaceae bacterium]
MEFSLFQLFLGFIAAILISTLAYLVRSLNLSGAIAAAILGTITFGLGGLSWAIILLGFFISSSFLSHFLKKRKEQFAEKFSKGSRRDFGQVIANGGIAGLFVIAHLIFPESTLPWFGYAATLAAANADTWATELGVLSKNEPHLITSGKVVERGTSGGVTWFGTSAAFAGAAFIALLAVLFWPGGFFIVSLITAVVYFFVIAIAGLVGSLIDSLLGATLQAIYCCPACQKETERHPLHTCNTPTNQIRGLRWLNNDWVNITCTITGAILACVLGLSLSSTGLFSTSQAVEGGVSMSDLQISIPAFSEGKTIPVKFTCTGENLSPALSWIKTPAGTKSLALVLDDPDAPGGLFVHWVIYNLPPELTELIEGSGTPGPVWGTPGKNSYGHSKYDGPCPPPGKAHRYYFTLYATDLEPTLAAGMNASQLRQQLKGHILGQASWMGTYQR